MRWGRFLPAFVLCLLGAVRPLVASHLNSGNGHSSRLKCHSPLRRRRSSTVRVSLPGRMAYSEAGIAPLPAGHRSFERRPAMAVGDWSQGHLRYSRRALRRCLGPEPRCRAVRTCPSLGDQPGADQMPPSLRSALWNPRIQGWCRPSTSSSWCNSRYLPCHAQLGMVRLLVSSGGSPTGPHGDAAD
ncbi:MAG: hypothetical protein V7646_49 [Pseudonocardia sp.]